MVIYEKVSDYLLTCTTRRERIAAIDAIITVLLASSLDAAATGGIDEYSLDDGQTKIRTKYRSISDIQSAIERLEKMRTYYVNQGIGRTVRLVSSDAMPPRRPR